MISKILNTIVAVFILVILFLYFGLPKELDIAEFTTTKSEYSANEEIYFRIEVTQKAYYYLYTYNANDIRVLLYPRKSVHQNSLNANKMVRSGGFSVIRNPKYRDEKVMLIVSRHPLSGIKKEMSVEGFSKMLIDNRDTMTVEIEGEQVIRQRIVSVQINKSKAHITIDTKNTNYKLTEDIDLDVTSLVEGYAHIFEATPTENITKLKSGRVKRVFRSFTVANEPLGRHIAIAIYTKEDENIKSTDFTISMEMVKGESIYDLIFKNGEQYTYDIQEFKVIP